MNPVDEFARLKAEIRRLQDRADALREGFLRPEARLRSNQFEIRVKRSKRRLFQKDRLPETILADPRYWDERETEIVTCHEIGETWARDDDEIVLIDQSARRPDLPQGGGGKTAGGVGAEGQAWCALS